MIARITYSDRPNYIYDKGLRLVARFCGLSLLISLRGGGSVPVFHGLQAVHSPAQSAVFSAKEHTGRRARRGCVSGVANGV